MTHLKVKIKLSGDGTKMSRLTSFITVSFSVLNNDEDLMSSKGKLYSVIPKLEHVMTNCIDHCYNR